MSGYSRTGLDYCLPLMTHLTGKYVRPTDQQPATMKTCFSYPGAVAVNNQVLQPHGSTSNTSIHLTEPEKMRNHNRISNPKLGATEDVLGYTLHTSSEPSLQEILQAVTLSPASVSSTVVPRPKCLV